MRVLAAVSLGGPGHLGPLVPFLDAAVARGDEVLVVGPPAMADPVTATGHRFHAGGEPSEAQIAPIREQLPVLPADEAAVLGNRELFGRLAALPMLQPVHDLVVSWQPDLVLRDPCEHASAVVAHERGVPVAQVAISLAQVERGSLDVAAPTLEALRVGLSDEERAEPYLTRFPASFDPSPFPTTHRYRDAAATPEGSLPSWWGDDARPLVYVTFGTVLGHMSIARDVLRAAADAVAEVDARVLLTTGRAVEPADLGSLPSYVHVEQWVDQAAVLAHAALVVCHGGSGTVLGALGAGVPLVVVPVFADQHENARRVVDAGVGLVLDQVEAGEARRPPDRSDVAAISALVRRGLDDRALRDRALAVAGEQAAAPSAGTVLDRLAADR